MSRLEKEEISYGHTIDQRDEMKRAFSAAYELVMGEPIEWSDTYHISEALQDMDKKLISERGDPVFPALNREKLKHLVPPYLPESVYKRMASKAKGN